ncbi:hypothetical protein TNCV_2784681 [Trichonephila clavipes]|nr:hypothetical protein TNCV_2784681 [Trichonephila clavipes]
MIREWQMADSRPPSERFLCAPLPSVVGVVSCRLGGLEVANPLRKPKVAGSTQDEVDRFSRCENSSEDCFLIQASKFGRENRTRWCNHMKCGPQSRGFAVSAKAKLPKCSP